MEQLAAVMKMDRIAKELGVELNGDAVLARAEQLVRMEEDTLHKAKSAQVLLAY